jgi:hypothetical protein
MAIDGEAGEMNDPPGVAHRKRSGGDRHAIRLGDTRVTLPSECMRRPYAFVERRARALEDRKKLCV